MQPLTVLVLGSSGYLGRQVIKQLRGRGVTAVGADVRLVPGLAEHVFDMRFPYQTLSLLSEIRPDVVVSLGYLLTLDIRANLHNSLHANVLGVNGIFDAAMKLGVSRVLFASSNPVYGEQSDFGDAEIREDSPRHPRVPYALMKQFNEDIAGIYNESGNTQIVSVILSSLHGRDKGGIFNPLDLMIAAAGTTAEVTLPWSAAHEFSFLHVDDAAAIFVELALAPRLEWTTYNSGGDAMTMRRLADLAGPRCGLRVSFEEPGRQLAHCSRLNSERLESELRFARKSPEHWIAFELERAGKGV